MYKQGDAFAGELYEHSALVVAHVVQGVANVLNIDLADSTSAIVAHGGAFKFPSYGERVAQILSHHNEHDVQLIMTKDFTDPSTNACLNGAAIAALTSSPN